MCQTKVSVAVVPARNSVIACRNSARSERRLWGAVFLVNSVQKGVSLGKRVEIVAAILVIEIKGSAESVQYDFPFCSVERRAAICLRLFHCCSFF